MLGIILHCYIKLCFLLKSHVVFPFDERAIIYLTPQLIGILVARLSPPPFPNNTTRKHPLYLSVCLGKYVYMMDFKRWYCSIKHL